MYCSQLSQLNLPYKVASLDWSREGTKIASTSLEMPIKIWDVLSQVLYTLEYPYIQSQISCSHDSSRIAIATDKTVSVWNAKDRKKFSSLEVHCISSLAWSQDASRIATDLIVTKLLGFAFIIKSNGNQVK
jgi:WD40 repeat protein